VPSSLRIDDGRQKQRQPLKMQHAQGATDGATTGHQGITRDEGGECHHAGQNPAVPLDPSQEISVAHHTNLSLALPLHHPEQIDESSGNAKAEKE
jgi:hypothetical protein